MENRKSEHSASKQFRLETMGGHMWVKGCLYSNFTIVFNTYVNLEFRNKYVYTKALRYMYIYIYAVDWCIPVW